MRGHILRDAPEYFNYDGSVVPAHSGFRFEFMRIIPACVFFFGMCGFIISISKSAAISILGGVLYLIANYIFCINKEVPMFYMSFGLVSSELVLQSCLPLLVLGIALAVAGNIISKKRTVYN